MDDTISRAKAIAEVEKARTYVGHRYNIESMVGRDIFEMLDNIGLGISKLPSVQPTIMYIIMETLVECGIYGEEATIKLIGTLKRIGRDDLLPPCAR